MPVSLGSILRYLLQKSADSKARKRTFPRKYPAVWPTELHVDAYPTFSLDNMVRAQPSTAISLDTKEERRDVRAGLYTEQTSAYVYLSHLCGC